MDAGYDALETLAAEFPKVKERSEDGNRSHRSHRERDERGEETRDRDRDRDRDRERRHRDSGRDRDRDREREFRDRDRDRERERDRDGHRDRERERDRGDRERERDPRDDRGDDRRPPRRRRDEDEDPRGGVGIAEPMGGHRDRRPRYEEPAFAQPMRGYSSPPPRARREDDRDWRGDRRDNRDRFDDRRDPRGGRGGRRDRTPMRSPTPEGVVPIEERKVEPSLWDVRPVQFEGVGAMQAKMTGMFTYGPGRVPPPIHLGVGPILIAGSFPPSDLAAGIINPLRQSKRLYIGNVTDALTEDGLRDFFNKSMHENKLAVEMPGEPVANVQLNIEKGYAFIEFRTSDEATSALAFDGLTCQGVPLRVRRPKDYIGIDPSLGYPGIAAGSGDSPNKLFVGGLPTYLNDEQVMELLKSFGELRSFNLVKDGTGQTSVSKGFAFCEYLDPAVTDMAIQGLHNFALGDRTLVVQRAATGRNPATGAPSAIPGSAGFLQIAAPNILSNASNAAAPTSRVMLLLNMVTPEELIKDDDYEEILEDIKEECGKYGEIEGVRIPRPVPKSKKWEPSDSAAVTAEKNRKADEEAGVGRVYVMYRDIESTKKAMKAIGGRQFAGRTILVANVSEEEFLGPAPPPPPPEDLDAAAADAVKDIMAGLE